MSATMQAAHVALSVAVAEAILRRAGSNDAINRIVVITALYTLSVYAMHGPQTSQPVDTRTQPSPRGRMRYGLRGEVNALSGFLQRTLLF